MQCQVDFVRSAFRYATQVLIRRQRRNARIQREQIWAVNPGHLQNRSSAWLNTHMQQEPSLTGGHLEYNRRLDEYTYCKMRAQGLSTSVMPTPAEGSGFSEETMKLPTSYSLDGQRFLERATSGLSNQRSFPGSYQDAGGVRKQ